MPFSGVEQLGAQVQRHEKDLYWGNGKPGLTTRVQAAETCLDTHEDRMTKIETAVEKIDKKFWAIIVLLVTMLGGITTDVIMKSTGHSGISTIGDR